MDLSNIRAITNNYQDARLISLKRWKHASEVQPCDHGGPYVVGQQGYDPQDPQMNYSEFVLGRSGKWLQLATFFRLPRDIQKEEFIFGTAAEVIQVMDTLNSRPTVEHGQPQREGGDTPDAQDLRSAIEEGKQSA